MKNHEIGRILRDISQLETEFNQESAEAWRRVEHCFKSPSIRNSSSSTEVAWVYPNVQKEIFLFAIIFHLHFFSECFNPIVSYCAIILYLLCLRSNSLNLQSFIQIKFVRFSYGSQTSEKHLKTKIGLQIQEKHGWRICYRRCAGAPDEQARTCPRNIMLYRNAIQPDNFKADWWSRCA